MEGGLSVSYKWHRIFLNLGADFSNVGKLDFCFLFSDGSIKNIYFFVGSEGKVVINLSDFSMPIVSISFGFLGEDGEYKKVEVLNKLFPLNDSEYEKIFIRKIQRIAGEDLQFFVAFQIWNYFTGKYAYKCNAAVVLAYKSVEIDNDRLILEAKKACEIASDNVINKCEYDWHPRRNSEHLMVSLLCARYHLALAEKNKNDFLICLYEIEKSIMKINNFFTPSYVIGLGLLLLFLVKFKRNEFSDAEGIIFKLEKVFKFAVRDATIDKTTLFDELKVTHRSLVLAKKVFVGEMEVEEAFKHSIRVKGKTDNLFKNFNEMFGFF